MINRIMIFIPSLGGGGAERVTSYLANYLNNECDVAVVTCSEITSSDYYIDSKVKKYIANGKRQIRNVVKHFMPNLIIIMFAPMGISVVPAIRGMKIPFIISERNDPKNFSGKRITRVLYQYYMTKANGLVFQTQEAADYYKRKYNGISAIIYNPLSLNKFPDIYTGEREKVIVNVGRLHYQKNQALLIKAFDEVHKLYPEYSLEIYGEGDLRGNLQKLIVSLNLESSVKLMGNRSDVLELERTKSIFVMSSDFEGMPNALIEAMALGIPVISTDCPCGGPRELIKDHVNGTLVPVGDIKALKLAIIELLEHEELARKYSDNELEIRNQLDEKKIMKQWLDFCSRVVGRNSL